MEVYNLGLVRPSIILLAVVTTITEFMKKKVLKCLRDKKVVDIGLLIPATLCQVITEVIKVVDIGLNRTVTIPKVIT